MQSGNPEPADTLRYLVEQKRNTPSQTCEIVSEASRWLKSELSGAELKFQYAECDERAHYGFSAVTVIRTNGGTQMLLEIKIAEIGAAPFAFAQVRLMGRYDSSLFPLFTEISSHSGRQLLLHYISDFILSTDAEIR